MAFQFLVPLWGEAFTRRYAEIFLPAQLPNLVGFRGEVYKIITTPESEYVIRNCGAYRDLASMMEVQFLPLGDPANNYRRMSMGYEIGLRNASPDTSFVFLTPDSIWSLGSFDALKRLVDSGYRAVMVSGPRANLEGFMPEFLETGGINGITARSLSRLLEKHLHKQFRAFMRGQPFHNTHPAALYWEVDGGLVARHFVQHPLLVRPRKVIRTIEQTVDHSLATLVPRSEVYVCRDSDEILGVDIGPQEFYQRIVKPGPLTDEHVVHWLLGEWPTRFHRWLGRHTVYFHSKEIGPEHLEAADEAEKTVKRIYRRVPPMGFVYAPRSTLKGMLTAAPTKSKAPWYRKILSLDLLGLAVFPQLKTANSKAAAYTLTGTIGDSFRRISVPNAATDSLSLADFPQLEGSTIVRADDKETPEGEAAYALIETAGYGFHRINVPNVALFSNRVNVINLDVRPDARTDLRVELLGESPSDYGRADFNLSTGEIEQSHNAKVASTMPLKDGWLRISFGVQLAASRGVVSVDLLDSDGAVNYRGISGEGLMICVPRLQSK